VPNYVTPEVEIAPLPGNAASIVNALRAHSPTTFTPTAPALKGAIEHMKGWAPAHPGRRPAVVLVTDGYPTECTPQAIAEIAQIAAEGYSSTPRVLTYVVGLVSGGSLDNMNGIAAAGGTGHARAVIGPDVASQLEGAMLDIATTPACTPSANGCGAGCGPIEFRAGHDPSGGPLTIEPGTETEICFGFHVDGTTLRQVTTATPLLDDTAVVHDMALFQMNAPEVNGSAQNCPTVTSTAPPPGGTLVWSWMPPTRGTGPVSFDIPPGDFELAVHYVNIDAFPHVNDTSGASVCACGI
jgi:hypothetical protein